MDFYFILLVRPCRPSPDDDELGPDPVLLTDKKFMWKPMQVERTAALPRQLGCFTSSPGASAAASPLLLNCNNLPQPEWKNRKSFQLLQKFTTRDCHSDGSLVLDTQHTHTHGAVENTRKTGARFFPLNHWLAEACFVCVTNFSFPITSAWARLRSHDNFDFTHKNYG